MKASLFDALTGQ